MRLVLTAAVESAGCGRSGFNSSGRAPTGAAHIRITADQLACLGEYLVAIQTPGDPEEVIPRDLAFAAGNDTVAVILGGPVVTDVPRAGLA
ncbi:hypothetical protein ACQB60_06715 [Actinomycetota bacterium Odt1-20B]